MTMAQSLPSSEPASASVFPRSIHLTGQGQPRTGLTLRDVNDIIAKRDGYLWVDVDTNDASQVELFKGIKDLHPLSIDDVLNRKSRPKLEEYPNYLFMVILGLRLHEETDDPYD
ncbi:MAG TPA: CorA family divalent cation transporter, partial [Gemmatimonadaceae bacterium]|nr:CorA family divalent cation transporter [Gemmatimonadaceae bacterium]